MSKIINFSFIIPHKNTPDLLQKCLDSIPRRDDVQIIVVDDNSDTDKVDFSNFPGLNDPTVEVYLTKEGKGAGYARNVGLSHAIGKWIVFADADDFFMPDLAKAMDEYVCSNWDVVFFKASSIELYSQKPSYRDTNINKAVDQALSFNDYQRFYGLSVPVCKFIKKALIELHDIHFNEVRWSNDVAFSALIIANAKSITASPIQIYCITRSNSSLTSNKSLACRQCRFKESIKEMKILKPFVRRNKEFHFWFYRSWYDVYTEGHISGITFLPQCLLYGGRNFLKNFMKMFFIDEYNRSSHIKSFYQSLKRRKR